jgi:Fe-S cluster biogenesis protein NfuA/nitrite reductase/ring-hydroxylating ferredoxin subunit
MGPQGLPPHDDQHDAQWRTAGDRIQTLLDASAAGGTAARERAEQLVREVIDLYGAGLQRMMHLSISARPDLAEDFAADDLLASLLLVHGLHPHSVEQRIAGALDSVRPYLGSHGGDVDLLEVDGQTVRLRFAGSCKSCPSASVTLELAVEDAVRAAAPEIASIEVISTQPPTGAVIPTESLLARIHGDSPRTAWQPVPDLADLAPGEVGGFLVAGTRVLACRVDGELFAYRDRCAHCTASMAGARLDGAVLGCPHCGARFDPVRAGAQIDGDLHLDPVPVLTRNGVLSMAVAQEVA